MRYAPALLLFASVGLAAPVPKVKPSIEDLYGKVLPSFEGCIVTMDRDRRLLMTKPGTGRACHPLDVASIGPALGKEAEGDFTLTTRMTLDLPTRAASTDRNSNGGEAGAVAGLCIHNGKERDEQCAAITVGKRDVNKGKPAWFEYHWGESKGASAGDLTKFDTSKPIWLRVSRKGKEVSLTYSFDGEKWENAGNFPVKGRVFVGPVAYGCTDKDFTVTFDEYELKTGEK